MALGGNLALGEGSRSLLTLSRNRFNGGESKSAEAGLATGGIHRCAVWRQLVLEATSVSGNVAWRQLAFIALAFPFPLLLFPSPLFGLQVWKTVRP